MIGWWISVGHGVSNMLFGGSPHSAPAEQPQQPVQQQQQQESQKPSCEVQAKGESSTTSHNGIYI